MRGQNCDGLPVTSGAGMNNDLVIYPLLLGWESPSQGLVLGRDSLGRQW